ncbi:MAG TPA: magnesium/cobalt transporter CorA [Fimbriimonadaceae bacterium]|nr:magnesium/cobalt transporter CorA [Fimbriimonadaceae bacterium]
MKDKITPVIAKNLRRGVRRITRILTPKKLTKPGSTPGVVTTAPEAHKTAIDVIAYSAETVHEAKDTSLESVRALRQDTSVLWLDVSGVGDAEIIEAIGKEFDIHRLVLEDVADTTQRAKVEEFENFVYVVCRMPHVTKHELEIEQVSLIVLPGVLVSFQEKPGDCFDAVRERIRGGRGRIRTDGADYLAYALIDAVVDSYFPVVEQLGYDLDDLEDAVIEDPNDSEMSSVHSIKRDLLVLRRALWPHREALSSLVRDEHPLVARETKTFLRDVYDHVIQVTDILETYREVCADLRDLYLSAVSNRMNEIMKVLTIIATIFIPLTFIVGVYGMNFDMPEIHSRYGYPITMGAMGLIAIAMLLYFLKIGWLNIRR